MTHEKYLIILYHIVGNPWVISYENRSFFGFVSELVCI